MLAGAPGLGVVDQDVEPTVGVDSERDHVPDVGLDPDVGGFGDGGAAVGFDGLDGGRAFVPPQGGDHDVRTFTSVELRDCSADPAPGSGDDGGLALESHDWVAMSLRTRSTMLGKRAVAVQPPSMRSSAPLTKPDLSLTRKVARSAMSSRVP